jgi:CubicO group peptidase (beta-lactamase class C family)
MRHQWLATLAIALGLVFPLVSICYRTAAAQVSAPWPTEGWQTSTPEEQGMDSTALVKLIEFGRSLRFDSLLIARHGKIVLDVYYAPYYAELPHAINSATKSIIATLTAIANKDGLLDNLDHRMLDFFRDRGFPEVDDKKSTITIQNLLDMTSGIDWEEPLEGSSTSLIEMQKSRDWIKFVLDRPMANAPGNTFNYNSGNSQLLSAIITKLTGKDARDYAKAKLFAPLGIKTVSWLRDPQLNAIGGFGLAMLPRDMAKIGYLYLRNGEWNGQKLLPNAWIDKASHATIDMKLSGNPNLRYSNSFWSLPNKKVYMAVGYHCQLIMVFPDLDIVAVTTARDFCPFGRLADSISGSVKSETPLPPDPEAANLLSTAIRFVSTDWAPEDGPAQSR